MAQGRKNGQGMDDISERTGLDNADAGGWTFSQANGQPCHLAKTPFPSPGEGRNVNHVGCCGNVGSLRREWSEAPHDDDPPGPAVGPGAGDGRPGARGSDVPARSRG